MPLLNLNSVMWSEQSDSFVTKCNQSRRKIKTNGDYLCLKAEIACLTIWFRICRALMKRIFSNRRTFWSVGKPLNNSSSLSSCIQIITYNPVKDSFNFFIERRDEPCWQERVKGKRNKMILLASHSHILTFSLILFRRHVFTIEICIDTCELEWTHKSNDKKCN